MHIQKQKKIHQNFVCLNIEDEIYLSENQAEKYYSIPSRSLNENKRTFSS